VDNSGGPGFPRPDPFVLFPTDRFSAGRSHVPISGGTHCYTSIRDPAMPDNSGSELASAG
jgi:hypothetical protein